MKRLTTLLLTLVASLAVAQSIHINDNGTLREITEVWINDNGTLRQIESAWINDNGTLRQVFSSGPSVSPVADGDFNVCLSPPAAQCWVGARFSSNGNEYEDSGTNSWIINIGAWLDSGSASDVWVAFTRTGGTETKWDAHTNGTRYNLGTTQTFSLSPSNLVVDDISGYFTFYDAATGGNTLATTTTATWTVELTDGGT